jgi:uncharacterized protein with FMN-binding domain
VKRSPFIVFGTLAGLVGALSFHSSPVKITLGSLPSSAPATSASTANTNASPPPTTTSTRPPSTPTSTTTSPPVTSTTQPVATTTPPATTTVPPTTTTTATSSIRSATGASVNYDFGVLSVRVTVSGTKITSVAIAALNDGGNSRSMSIDDMAIPQLKQQALQAQSANIQGVSGASYTSAGFKQSLQSALNQLGVK